MNKAPGIYPRALLSTIVHDYFLNRGVPGSADMIPSACEPVLFLIMLYQKLEKMQPKRLKISVCDCV